MSNLNNVYEISKNRIFNLIYEKKVDVGLLSFYLSLDKIDFLNKLQHDKDDFTFYLHVLNILDNWEANYE